MAKILLVEDDKSLREIYGVRLQAEGYDIITASDGEQALAVAIKERPTLIITDVMMPKISGFDMADILRSTAETKDIKLIMMTALSSDDQRARGEQIGADRYLVKSQVGIEDVVHTVHEVLGDKPSSPPSTPPSPGPAAPSPSAPPTPQPMPAPPQAPSAPAPPPPQIPPTPQSPTTMPPAQPVQEPPKPLQPSVSSSSTPTTPSSRQRTIQPINDPHARIDINELLDKELAKEAGLDTTNRPQVATTAQEKAIVNDQIQKATAPAAQQTTTPSSTPQSTNRPNPIAPQRIIDVSPPRPQ